MKEENKDFEYTSDNYTGAVYEHGKSLFDTQCTQSKEFDKYIGDLRTAQGNNLRNNSLNDTYVDPIQGKTVDFYYFDEDNDFWFMGFTDGTFIVRERIDHNMFSTYPHEPNMHWGNAFLLKPELCVTNRLSNNDKPKITPIGKWIEEHTDADIIGYYREMVRQFEESEQRNKDAKRERDIKEYYRLKEILGL